MGVRMKLKLVILLVIGLLLIIMPAHLLAQDCSLNGAAPTDDCPVGTNGDDTFTITGEVNAIITLGDGNDVVSMSGGGTIIVTGTDAIVGTGSTGGGATVIGGTIIVTNGSGIYVTNATGDAIINSANITIIGTNNVAGIQNWYLVGDTAGVINSGNISVTTSNGCSICEQHDGDVVNSGNLTAVGNNNQPIGETGNGSVTNSGNLSADGVGSPGIWEFDDGDVINSGIIIATGTDSHGIVEESSGDVTNNGTVISIQAIGIVTDDDDDTVINNGTVTGATTAIDTGDGNDTVVNNGTANGDVNLGDGDDTMHVRNHVNGTMDGGDGTDTIIFELVVGGTTEELNRVAQEIADANPQGGTIVINGQRYRWQNFEQLVDLLTYIDTSKHLPCATDGRLNDYDCHAPVVLYGYPLQIYAVHPETGAGTFAFSISQAEVDAAGIPESGTVLIKEGTHPDTGTRIAIYRHADGQFQVNAFFADMKPYVAIWEQYGHFVNVSGEQG